MLVKKIFIILSASALLFIFNACENRNNTELFWQITQCADPWWEDGVDLNSRAYLDLMTTYMLTKDVVVQDHFIENSDDASGEDCDRCACNEAFRIRTIFLDEDVDKAKAEGFTEG